MCLGKLDNLTEQSHWYNWATKIVDGVSANTFAEDQIQDYWYPYEWWNTPGHPCLFKIDADPYDHSLELDVAYIDSEEKAIEFFDTKVTKELYDFISNNGVKHFWINFYSDEEKSEQKKYEISVGSRSKSLKKVHENGKSVAITLKHSTL